MPPIVPIILSGGSGSRLWPVSTADHPKQFHALGGDRSLFEETLHRLSGPDFAAPIIVCNQAHEVFIDEALAATGTTGAQLVLEPVGRNTAPAITLAALLQVGQDPDVLMLVAASDSSITRPDRFLDAVRTATKAAGDDMIVTFGMTPNRPETGYGYILRGAAIEESAGLYRVASFVEKPDMATAERYLTGGQHTWNSSMFLFRAQMFLDELGRQRPDILNGCRASLDAGIVRGAVTVPECSAFESIAGESIDFAVMENCAHAAVVEAEFGWSDVGSWQALWELGTNAPDENVIRGNVIVEDSHGCLIRADDGAQIALIGCEDLVVVSAGNRVLVVPKHRSQDVRRVTDKIG